jgi:hypothetical protein
VPSQGPRSSTSESSPDGVFTNLSRIRAVDSSTSDCDFSTDTDGVLNATGFGFTLPVGSTVLGIAVDLWAKYTQTSGDSIIPVHVSLIGGISSHHEDLANLSLSITQYTLGDSTNTWGETWTYSQINDSSFGVSLTFLPADSTVVNVNVDAVKVTVYYDTAVPAVASSFCCDRSTFGTVAISTAVVHSSDRPAERALLRPATASFCIALDRSAGRDVAPAAAISPLCAASDESAGRDMGAGVIPAGGAYGYADAAGRSEWAVILATPLIQSAHANERAIAPEYGQLKSQAKFFGGEASAAEEMGHSRALVPAGGSDEPACRDGVASRGGLFASAASEARARDRIVQPASTARALAVDFSAAEERGVFIVKAQQLADDNAFSTAVASEDVASVLFGSDSVAESAFSSTLTYAQQQTSDRSSPETSAAATIDAQAHSLSEPREAIGSDALAGASLTATENSASRDLSRPIISAGLLAADEAAVRSQAVELAVALPAGNETAAAFSGGAEHVRAAAPAGRSFATFETLVTNIWATGVDYSLLKSFRGAAFGRIRRYSL